jgi:hypothetical protein
LFATRTIGGILTLLFVKSALVVKGQEATVCSKLLTLQNLLVPIRFGYALELDLLRRLVYHQSHSTRREGSQVPSV